MTGILKNSAIYNSEFDIMIAKCSYEKLESSQSKLKDAGVTNTLIVIADEKDLSNLDYCLAMTNNEGNIVRLTPSTREFNEMKDQIETLTNKIENYSNGGSNSGSNNGSNNNSNNGSNDKEDEHVCNLFDIMYVNRNTEEIVISPEIKEYGEDLRPIGICIAPTNFFGEGEKARFMSLLYMDLTNPETGTLNKRKMKWGYAYDIPVLSNITSTHFDSGLSNVFIKTDYFTSDEYTFVSLTKSDGSWNDTIIGLKNRYALSDIDGKNKTSKILSYTRDDWSTIESIPNSSSSGNYPPVIACSRYHTIGTNSGDWYLPACGELAVMLMNKTILNEIIRSLKSIYGVLGTVFSNIETVRYWSSSESNKNEVYTVYAMDGYVDTQEKTTDLYTIAMMQY